MISGWKYLGPETCVMDLACEDSRLRDARTSELPHVKHTVLKPKTQTPSKTVIPQSDSPSNSKKTSLRLVQAASPLTPRSGPGGAASASGLGFRVAVVRANKV